MTRINVVPVDELTDNFLLAEHFELPRIFMMVRRYVDKGKLPADIAIPEAYTYGEGHMKFFADKLRWLYQRHTNLQIAGTARGLDLKIDPACEGYDPLWFQDTPWWGVYVPTLDAIRLNWDRLQLRRRYDGGTYTIP